MSCHGIKVLSWEVYYGVGDSNKKAPSDGASAQIASSFDSFHELKYRRIWHLAFTQVAGLHRADPSTALDKVSYKIIVISLSDFTAHVNRYSIKKRLNSCAYFYITCALWRP